MEAATVMERSRYGSNVTVSLRVQRYRAATVMERSRYGSNVTVSLRVQRYRDGMRRAGLRRE
jgi:hypothetical protein